MKSQKFIFLFMALLSFSSCIIYVDNIPDSEVFKSFEPLEWSDDYVFLPTDLPQQIQVWNSKTKKLVYTYELLKEMKVYGKSFERALSINDMVVIDKDIWLSGTGVNNNLLKINVPTGQVKYLLRDDRIVSMVADRTWENNEGCLFGMTVSIPNKGMTVYKFSLNGNLLEKKEIIDEDLYITNLNSVQFIDNQYYLIGSKYEHFYPEILNQKGIKLINLSETGNYISNVEYEKLFPKQFLNDNLKIVPDSFLINFNAFYNMKDNYLSAAIAGYKDYENKDSEYICARFLFKIISFNSDFEVEYTGINYQNEESRAICTVSENEENLFLTGRVLYGNNFTGLETGVYSKATGKELYRMRMENSNQLHCEIKDDKTWFPQDVNLQDQNLKRYSIPKGCYMLDHKTGKTYWYDENGNENEIERISGQLK